MPRDLVQYWAILLLRVLLIAAAFLYVQHPSHAVFVAWVALWYVLNVVTGSFVMRRSIAFWMIAVIYLVVAGGFALFYDFPKLGAAGKMFLGASFFYTGFIIREAERLLFRVNFRTYLAVFAVLLIEIVGISWMVLFSFINLRWFMAYQALALLVGLAGAYFLRVGREDKADKAVLSSSVVLLLLALYCMMLALFVKLIYLWGLYPKVFFSVLLALFVFSLFMYIFLQIGRRREILNRIKRVLLPSYYDYHEEWESFISDVSDVFDKRQVLLNLSVYLKERFGVDDIVLWEREGVRYSLKWGFSNCRLVENRDFIKWLWLSGEISLKEELSRFKNSAPGDVDAIIPLIVQRQMIGILGLRKKGNLSEAEKDFLITLSRNISYVLFSINLFEAAMEAKEIASFQKVAAYIMHDLKNSFAVLSLIVENSKNNLHNINFVKDAFSSLEKTLSNINDLMSKLKGIERESQASVDRRHYEEVRLDLLLVDIIKDLNIEGAAEVEIVTALKPVSIKCEREAIKRAFKNIILNGFEALEGRGRLEVTMKDEQDDIHILIVDNGVGMDQSFIDNYLFKPFHSTKKKGLGIGMYETKATIERHMGTIFIRSEKKKGTEVEIILPKGDWYGGEAQDFNN